MLSSQERNQNFQKETRPITKNFYILQIVISQGRTSHHWPPQWGRVRAGPRHQTTVDQVTRAAVNIFQGCTGSNNGRTPYTELKCCLVLDMAYQGTYLTCINNRRSQIYLTLVGGGIFGNKKEWIYDAIITAHLKFGVKGKSSLQKVILIVFNPRDITESFIRRMKEEGIPVTYVAQEGEEKERDDFF